MVEKITTSVIPTTTVASLASLGVGVPSGAHGLVGYTTRLTCGVWVGMDKPQRIADRGYGSKLALPIWVDFIQSASAWKYIAQNFAVPGDLQTVELCRTSGAIATPECKAAGTSYQAQLPAMMISRKYCPVHGGVLAGVPTDGSESRPAPSSSAPFAQVTSEDVPIARPAPVAQETAEQTPPPGASYRMIRRQNGFIFESAR